MSGSTSACTPRVAEVACAAVAGTGTVRGSVLSVRGPGKSGAPVPVLPPQCQGTGMDGEWPLRDFIELGAVPCSRLHARQLMWEWGFIRLSQSVELLVSELVTNAIHASRALERITPVRLWLLADKTRVLILVWDASSQAPARVSVSEALRAAGG